MGRQDNTFQYKQAILESRHGALCQLGSNIFNLKEL
jgi:hypothetical protein